MADKIAIIEKRLSRRGDTYHDIVLRSQAVEQRGKASEQRDEQRAALLRSGLLDLLI